MKVATWNVNSIRARLGNVVAWLEDAKPDVVLLQELKCQEDAFPRLEIETLGYNVAITGQKTYNGVAVLSLAPMEIELTALPGDETDEQARYLQCLIGPMRIASLYLPNGNPAPSEKFDYKLSWMDRLITHARDLLVLEDITILGGDYNVISTPDDVHDPAAWRGDALFRLESRNRFRQLEAMGFTDAVRALDRRPGLYSFWDYQGGALQKDYGVRIDHLMLSPQAADQLDCAGIDTAPMKQDKRSDHTPVWCKLDLEVGAVR